MCYAMPCYAILYYTILYYSILYYTIGMLIESIAAKAASADGKPAADGTTFREYYGHLIVMIMII